MPTPLTGFVTAVAGSLVQAQNALDDAGRGSVDAFGDTGVTPTVLAWNDVRFVVPLGVAVLPRADASQTSKATITMDGDGRLTIAVRYLPSPQGVDDPHPVPDTLIPVPGLSVRGPDEPREGEST